MNHRLRRIVPLQAIFVITRRHGAIDDTFGEDAAARPRGKTEAPGFANVSEFIFYPVRPFVKRELCRRKG